MNAFMIDAFDFCRRNERGEGEIAVADLPRLAEESLDGSGSIRWSLQGGSNSFGHPQMRLSVVGSVQLRCQRCLMPFALEIQAETLLVLAKDESGADEIESLLEDESVEVIVGSKAFNVIDLVEDEALLAIPLSPKHDVCPDPFISSVLEDGLSAASPFAVLKNLKQ
jgi:uncharacterized protein